MSVLSEARKKSQISFDFADGLLWLVQQKIPNLAGKKVLDLGCGAGKEELVGNALWYPAFLLLASEEGAIGTGIDIDDFPESAGTYYHLPLNLIPYLRDTLELTTILNTLPENHRPPYDLIICTRLIEIFSPTLQTLLDLPLHGENSKIQEHMKQRLMAQAGQLGKVGTIIVTDNAVNTLQENGGIQTELL